MGCQENIAKTIIENKGDYLLAVKNNQAKLYQNMEDIQTKMTMLTMEELKQENAQL